MPTATDPPQRSVVPRSPSGCSHTQAPWVTNNATPAVIMPRPHGTAAAGVLLGVAYACMQWVSADAHDLLRVLHLLPVLGAILNCCISSAANHPQKI